MYLSSVFLLLLYVALARPASHVSSEDDNQTWKVTRLDYHYMTEWPGFGPPHTEWPEGRKFNSTISLDVQIPDELAPGSNWVYKCDMNWEHSVLPGISADCIPQSIHKHVHDNVAFFVEPWQIPGKDLPPGSPAEMPFSLTIQKTSVTQSWGPARRWLGNVTISCDDPGSPSSYLTCLTGPPFDGMRCKLGAINNIDLSNKTELQVFAQEVCDSTASC
ncbi:hypothetical protein BU23DRAFT_550122 [Bimuria novae-zelandiae CBS 107.79]|uniref:Ubiquitin 3 binding protein But2 C-terminal domain-containing protein n=1 Tax=Bimuria novae-zelandiae CBS 107.79 TaxID=1447943 RepID=A0A6A5VL86_9PLEO|nr:hypothetical protein BU23DRAFT_550122 [Bimuria novae-zelandiae CBS 107.79]